MSNTGQTDQGFNGEYHHDINLLLGRIAELEKIIEATNDRISILEGDVKYMTQECEKAENRKYDDYSTLRQLDELVNYRHIILTAKD